MTNDPLSCNSPFMWIGFLEPTKKRGLMDYLGLKNAQKKHARKKLVSFVAVVVDSVQVKLAFVRF